MAEAPSKKEKPVEEVTTLGPKLADGDEYFAVAHIFASSNDTFVVSSVIASITLPTDLILSMNSTSRIFQDERLCAE